MIELTLYIQKKPEYNSLWEEVLSQCRNDAESTVIRYICEVKGGVSLA